MKGGHKTGQLPPMASWFSCVTHRAMGETLMSDSHRLDWSVLSNGGIILDRELSEPLPRQ
jgi:hypothetical protein